MVRISPMTNEEIQIGQILAVCFFLFLFLTPMFFWLSGGRFLPEPELMEKIPGDHDYANILKEDTIASVDISSTTSYMINGEIVASYNLKSLVESRYNVTGYGDLDFSNCGDETNGARIVHTESKVYVLCLGRIGSFSENITNIFYYVNMVDGALRILDFQISEFNSSLGRGIFLSLSWNKVFAVNEWVEFNKVYFPQTDEIVNWDGYQSNLVYYGEYGETTYRIHNNVSNCYMSVESMSGNFVNYSIPLLINRTDLYCTQSLLEVYQYDDSNIPFILAVQSAKRILFVEESGRIITYNDPYDDDMEIEMISMYFTSQLYIHIIYSPTYIDAIPIPSPAEWFFYERNENGGLEQILYRRFNHEDYGRDGFNLRFLRTAFNALQITTDGYYFLSQVSFDGLKVLKFNMDEIQKQIDSKFDTELLFYAFGILVLFVEYNAFRKYFVRIKINTQRMD